MIGFVSQLTLDARRFILPLGRDEQFLSRFTKRKPALAALKFVGLSGSVSRKSR